MSTEQRQFSLVIPTMWKYPPFLDFLSVMLQMNIVGEAVIIDNDSAARPNHPALHNTKVKIHDFRKNIYVNPAWNFGVAVSRYNRICILNDDVIFDLKLFFKVDQEFTLGQFYNVSYDAAHNHAVTGEISIVPLAGIECIHGGTIMFIHKSNWIDIPAGLDICYGDNWLNDTMQTRYSQNYVVKNVFFYTPISTTSRSFTNPELLWREGLQYEAAFRRFRNTNGYPIVPGCTVQT